MKRRTFLKNMMAAGAVGSLQTSGLLSLVSCSSEKDSPTLPSSSDYNFDEVIDRTGTWSIKYSRVEKMGNDIIPMGIADMDFRTAPFMTEAYKARIERDVFGYTRTPQEFYECIANWESKQHDWNVTPDDITYIPGVITGINLAIQCFTEKGDKIIIQPPVYNPFKSYINKLGREAVDNPLKLVDGKYEMDFEHLESIIDDKTKGLILCNPQNPGGITWNKETLSQLASICAKHNVMVFSDEIHGDLTLFGKKHIPFLSVNEDATKVGIIFSSPTKAFNIAGIITAHTVIKSESIRKQYVEYLESGKFNEAPIFSLVSTITAYTNPTDWLEALKAYIEKNVEFVMDYFKTNIPQIKPYKPGASFLIWLDCSELNLDQKELADLFSEKAKLVVNNGAIYGPGGEGHIRINIGCPLSVLKKALDHLKEAVSTL